MPAMGFNKRRMESVRAAAAKEAEARRSRGAATAGAGRIVKEPCRGWYATRAAAEHGQGGRVPFDRPQLP